MGNPRAWLVGENNPYQDDPEEAQRYAMYPAPGPSADLPSGCAGWRLCHVVLGMSERAYLGAFERRNLLAQPRWSVPAARAAAAKLAEGISADDKVILLGAKVWAAWSAMMHPSDRPPTWEPFRSYSGLGRPNVLALPHPSGLSRAWNEPGAFARAREAVALLAPHLRALLGAGEVRR